MDNHATKSPPSFLRKLLVASGYRVVRHLALILILVVTALNQAFMTMREGLDVMGYGIFLQASFLLVTYLIVCYFNLWVFLPRYLLKKRYVEYALCLISSVFILVIIQTLEELAVLSHFNIADNFYTIPKVLDNFYTFPKVFITILSSFALVLLCVSGGAMTVLLRQWMIDNEKVNQLEKLHIQAEVEQLKELVNPNLLFSILNRTGVLAMCQPEEASDMLIKLSRLLRYQLYDCNRERVLLSAEIKFLDNYLTLEKMYSGLFEFNIRHDKGCSHMLVSPLLFISFVQATVNRIYELGKETSLNIGFETTDETVTFTCHCALEDAFLHIDFSKIQKRLDFLYPRKHSIIVNNKEMTLKLEI